MIVLACGCVCVHLSKRKKKEKKEKDEEKRDFFLVRVCESALKGRRGAGVSGDDDDDRRNIRGANR